jgi:hypothetical protein
MEPNQPMGPLAPSDPTERNHTAGVRSLRKLASGARVSVARRQHVKCGQISICAADTLPHHVVSPVMSIMLSSDYQGWGRSSSRTTARTRHTNKGPDTGERIFLRLDTQAEWQLASHRGVRLGPAVMDSSPAPRPARLQKKNATRHRSGPRSHGTASRSAASLP